VVVPTWRRSLCIYVIHLHPQASRRWITEPHRRPRCGQMGSRIYMLTLAESSDTYHCEFLSSNGRLQVIWMVSTTLGNLVQYRPCCIAQTGQLVNIWPRVRSSCERCGVGCWCWTRTPVLSTRCPRHPHCTLLLVCVQAAMSVITASCRGPHCRVPTLAARLGNGLYIISP